MQHENLLSDNISKLESWYWDFASKRSSAKAVSVRWLDDLLNVRDRLASHAEANRKPRIGIWGPSQSGKSTLISQGVDAGAEADGTGSALSWPGGEKVRFTGRSDTPASTVVFNPYNGKSDASGCVTRFVAAENVADPQHPVCASLLTPVQVVAAFAAGFADEVECKSWDNTSVQAFLDTLGEGRSAAHTRESLSALRELISVLELLSGVVTRFGVFRPEAGWRLRLLEHRALKGDLSKIRELRDKLLWDSNLTVASIVEKIERTRSVLGFSGRCDIRMPFSVAALLLDIDAAGKLNQKGATGESIEKEIGAWKITCDKNGALISKAGKGVSCDRDFACIQALIAELVVPVHPVVPVDSSFAGSAKSFADLLSRADLVDFPGLPNTAPEGSKKLELTELNETTWLTCVFKRGKTLSIVATGARQLDVDAFLLLINGSQAAKIQRPGPLRSTILSWSRAADAYFPETLEKAAEQGVRSPLPCVTAMTFFGEIIRDIHGSGNRNVSLGGLSHLSQIGALADSRFASMIPITYPTIPRGEMPPAGETRDETQRLVRENITFQKYFSAPEALAAYDAMFRDADGGAAHLFGFIAKLVNAETRRHLAAKSLAGCRTRVVALVGEHMPETDPDAARRRDLDSFLGCIDSKLAVADESTSPEAIGAALRSLLSVDYKDLDALPKDLQGRRARVYLESQINGWKDSALLLDANWNSLGLSDSVARARLVGYFASAINQDTIIDWMREHQSGIQNDFEAQAHRRFLAVHLTNALVHGGERPPHTRSDIAQATANRDKIGKIIRVQNDEDFMHSLMREVWVEPWLKSIRRLQSLSLPAPRNEPGDAELMALHVAL